MAEDGGSSSSASSASEDNNKKPEPPDSAGPTTETASSMQEAVEYDDFGLPTRRASPVRYSEEGGDDKEQRDAQHGEQKTVVKEPMEEKGEKKSRIEKGNDDDFEDAVAAPPPQPPHLEAPMPVEAGSRPELASNEEQAAPTVKNPSNTSAPMDDSEAVALADKEHKEEKARPDQREATKESERDAIPDATPEAPVTKGDTTQEEKVILDDKANEAQKVEVAAPISKRESTQQPVIAVNGISEFSHQQVTIPVKEARHNDEDEDGGWQTMPAFAPYDMYDDDNRLIAKEYNEEVEEDKTYSYAGMGGAGKGYTRVLVDDDAESATSMDENTNYLFKTAAGTSIVEDDETRDALSQMQATKDLLTEGQKIAYVGLARIEVAQMAKEIERLHVSKSTKKAVRLATEALKMWGQKIMIRIYSHMEISAAEQVMIEQLTEHGVISSDLTPQLMANARVKNPMADRKSSTSSSRPTSIASPKPTTSGLSSPGQQTPRTSRNFGEESPAEPPPAYDKHEGEELPAVRLPDQLPSSEKLDIDIRWTILCDLFLVLVADSIYDSRSRVLLERVGKALEIGWVDICRFEKRVTEALEMQQQAERENWNEDEHMESRRKLALKKRYIVMGLATVGGGLVIGLSAGLLAPVIGAGLAAGFTTIGVTGTTSFLGGAAASAIITSGAAASGSVIGARAANRRTGAVKTFEYRPLHNNKRVNLIVTVSGWMTGKVDDVRLPFSTVDPVMGDIYSVLWEPEMLTSMGDTINILATEALTQGLQQVLGSTILVSLMAALQLPVVLTKLSYLIDNPWSVSLDRAWAAGLILADSLIERNLGTRPITLVGYSLGSRVIFSCVLELARKGAFGIIENVYMFGSPLVVKQDEYLKCRTVISGRFVNGYHGNDWILGYLFRLTNGGIRRVAGLTSIQDVPGVENVDCSEFVAGHMDYRRAMPRLMREVGWLVESDEFTEIEDPDPENHTERQRELINEIEEARKELEKEGDNANSRKSGGFGGFFSRKKKAQKAEWEVYEDSKGNPSGGASSGRTEDSEGNNHGVLFDVEAMRAELANSAKEDDDTLQVRELRSTLPPMRIPSPRPATGSQSSWDQTRSEWATSSSSKHVSLDHGRSFGHHHDDGIQMTFDAGFDDHHRTPQRSQTVDSVSRPEFKTAQTASSISSAASNPWADMEDDDDDFGKEKEIEMTFA
ncbi:unnamed protein product [Discula destructiva]